MLSRGFSGASHPPSARSAGRGGGAGSAAAGGPWLAWLPPSGCSTRARGRRGPGNVPVCPRVSPGSGGPLWSLPVCAGKCQESSERAGLGGAGAPGPGAVRALSGELTVRGAAALLWGGTAQLGLGRRGEKREQAGAH